MFLSEVTLEAEQLRKEFVFLRGSAVSAFAHAEFMMKSFLLALTDDERFDDGGGYSHQIEKVTKHFLSSFEKSDLLNDLHEDVTIAMNAFNKVINDRNQFAHGLARLDVSKRKVTIERYRRTKQDNGNRVNSVYDLDTIEDKVRTFEKICLYIISLVNKLDIKYGLGLRAQNEN